MQNKHGPTLCFYTEKESRKKGGGRDGERKEGGGHLQASSNRVCLSLYTVTPSIGARKH